MKFGVMTSGYAPLTAAWTQPLPISKASSRQSAYKHSKGYPSDAHEWINEIPTVPTY